MLKAGLLFFVFSFIAVTARAETIHVESIDPSHITVADPAPTPPHVTPAPTPALFPRAEAIPKTVHLLKATSMTGAMGGVTMTKPAGTEVAAVISEDRKFVAISLKDPDLSGSAPIEDTDFMKLAWANESGMAEEERQKAERMKEFEATEKKRRFEEAEATMRQSAVDKAAAGSEPYWNETTLPSVVMRNLKRILKDPDSLKIREVFPPRMTDFNGQKCWKINARISSRNGFGGMVGGIMTAWIQKGNLLDLAVVPES